MNEEILTIITRCAICAIALMGGLGAGICLLQHDWAGALGATATVAGSIAIGIITGEI